MSFELEAWQEDAAPSAALKSLVEELLRAGDQTYGDWLAGAYFGLHARLSALPSLSHDLAAALLSHTLLIGGLAGKERMTAAQIARLIGTRDRRLQVGWREIQPIVRALGHEPGLQLSTVEEMFEEDARLEQEFFADADVLDCARILGAIAARLGLREEFADLLLALAPVTGAVHGPYLQMLHFLCAVAEMYDHALSRAYEFSPRGHAPGWLFERYPAALNIAGNPFLNNAKGVDNLDRDWAASKDGDQRAPSLALVSIIEAMDSLGFAARRELCGWIRRWLCRRIRLAEGQQVSIPRPLTDPQLDCLLTRAGRSNTQSRGIIEQRLVEALTLPMHPEPDWISRGVGDAVNANNISRRKFGDADFQKTADRRVVAYEPHGGTLSDIYVLDHLRSLEKVLPLRRTEWDENVAPGLRWTVDVVFVAHQLALGSGGTGRFDFANADTDVRFTAITFRDLVDQVRRSLPATALASTVDQRLIAIMAEPRTPDMARRRLLDLLVP